jgi:redox-sensitive bicupin YhaK (pirin superfamily)
VSNLETRPAEQLCRSGGADGVQILEPRTVPLGGPRAMTVRRTLPQRARSLVGAWCFADHYGPDDVTAGPGMQVPPHPHTGLQTVTWLFAGEVLHRDSVGSLETVRPGELNLMTAGRGISHSEETPAQTTARTLHGVQLWTALPSGALDGAPFFEHHEDLPVLRVEGAVAHVLVGTLALVTGAGSAEVVAASSPATAFTPLVGAQLDLAPGARVVVRTEPGFEHAVLLDAGAVRVAGVDVARDHLAYVAPGPGELVLEAGPDAVTDEAGTVGARVMLLGGEPFGEDVVMWWNFVGRTHDDVARARADWQAGLVMTSGEGPNHGGTVYAPGVADGRFGEVVGYAGGPLPAPALPDVHLKPRTRPAS